MTTRNPGFGWKERISHFSCLCGVVSPPPPDSSTTSSPIDLALALAFSLPSRLAWRCPVLRQSSHAQSHLSVLLLLTTTTHHVFFRATKKHPIPRATALPPLASQHSSCPSPMSLSQEPERWKDEQQPTMTSAACDRAFILPRPTCVFHRDPALPRRATEPRSSARVQCTWLQTQKMEGNKDKNVGEYRG